MSEKERKPKEKVEFLSLKNQGRLKYFSLFNPCFDILLLSLKKIKIYFDILRSMFKTYKNAFFLYQKKNAFFLQQQWRNY